MPSGSRTTRPCCSASPRPSSRRCWRRPPDPFSRRPADLWRLARTGWRFLKLGADGPRAVEILTAPARTILDRWFESDALKATLATDAIIGAMASPSTPGTAYVLLHHVMGECNGARGVWGYVRGGMGSLSEAIAGSARASASRSGSTPGWRGSRWWTGGAPAWCCRTGASSPPGGWSPALTPA